MSELNVASLKIFSNRFDPALYNKLVDAIQSLVIGPSVDLLVKRDITGTTLRLKGGNSGAAIPPFSVLSSPVAGNNTVVSITVRPGTANGFVPTNIFTPKIISKTGTFYAKLTIETDGQDVTSCEINIDGSAPDPQNATSNALPSTFDILLAIIKSGRVYQTISGSLALSGHEEFRIDKDSPAGPGESTQDIFFKWAITVI